MNALDRTGRKTRAACAFGVLLAAAACALLAQAAEAAPAGKTVCGVRRGTAGEAELAGPDGALAIRLASQGGDQHLLDQADGFIGPDTHGEIGTQNGTRYCVVVRLDAEGNPVAVVNAYRAKGH